MRFMGILIIVSTLYLAVHQGNIVGVLSFKIDDRLFLFILDRRKVLLASIAIEHLQIIQLGVAEFIFLIILQILNLN